MILDVGKTHPGIEMTTIKGRKLDIEAVVGACKDFLCSPESRIQEWFPTLLQARLRAKALDPYGIMKSTSSKGNFASGNVTMFYTCSIPTCHAKIMIRNVSPDPEGNPWGLFGCFEHQHELKSSERVSEIVFD